MFGEKVLVSLEITFFTVLPWGSALQGFLGLTLWFGFCLHLPKGLAVVLNTGQNLCWNVISKFLALKGMARALIFPSQQLSYFLIVYV